MSQSTFRDLIELGRLRFLFGGILLYLFGVQLALAGGGTLSLGRLLLGYAIVFGAHLSVSFSNDYFDYDGDSHSAPTPFSGGSGVLQRRPELRPVARAIALGLMAFSMLAAVAFVLLYDYPLWFLGVALFSNLLGWFYSAPPLRLTDTPLGEVATALSVGLLVYLFGSLVVSPTLSALVLRVAPAMLASGFLFILTVQIPDLEADRAAGKSTWVGNLGRTRSFRAILALALASVVYYLVLALWSSAGPVSFLLFAAIALLPVAPSALAALQRVEEKPTATTMVGAIMGASITTTVGFNIYLLLIRMRS